MLPSPLLFELFVNALETFIMTGFLTLYLKPKFTGAKPYVFFLLAWMASFSEICIINSVTAFERLAAYIPVVIYFVYALLCLRGKVLLKLWMSVITQIVVLITAVVSNLGICLVIGYDPLDMITVFNTTRVIGVLVSKVILIGVYFIILKTRRDEQLESRVWYFLIIVPLTSVYAVMMMMNMALDYPDTLVTVFFSMICIVVCNVAAYYFFAALSKEYRNRARLSLMEQQYKSLKEQAAGTQSFLHEMRVVRHDIGNHILSAMQLIRDGKAGEALTYLSRLTKDYLPESFSYVDSPNDALNAVLNTKLAASKRSGVTFDIKMQTNAFDRLDMIDTGVIFGNLLDNAFEAAVNSRERVITLTTGDTPGYVCLIIGNSIDASVLGTNKSLHTTKDASELHGIGIESVEAVVRKYDGILEFFEEKGRFYAQVMLAPDFEKNDIE